MTILIEAYLKIVADVDETMLGKIMVEDMIG